MPARPLRLKTPDEVRGRLRLGDRTVYVCDLGDRSARPQAFALAVYFYVLGCPAGTWLLCWALGLASPKTAFYVAALCAVALLGRRLAQYALALAGRGAPQAGGLSATFVLVGAACAAFVLAVPGPVRDGLVLDRPDGFLAWLRYCALQGFDIALAGLPRALGLTSLVPVAQTPAARAGLAAFNVGVALSLVEVARAVWGLHFQTDTRRGTVRALHRAVAGLATMDLDDDGEPRGVDLVCRARLAPLDKPVRTSAGDLAADDPDPTVHRWRVGPRRRSRARALGRAGAALALPALAFAAAHLASRFDAAVATVAATAAAALLMGWRLRSVRRTLAGSALEHRAAGALSIQVPGLLVAGPMIQVFTGDGPVRDGLALPADVGPAQWAHFFVYQVLNALLLDLPDSLNLFAPAIATTTRLGAVALSLFKLVVALGIVEGLVALWRSATGREVVFATRAEIAAALARLPATARAELTLVRTHAEEPLDPPLALTSGLLERAWNEQVRRRVWRRSPVPRRAAIAGAYALAAAGIVAIWLWAPDLRRAAAPGGRPDGGPPAATAGQPETARP